MREEEKCMSQTHQLCPCQTSKKLPFNRPMCVHRRGNSGWGSTFFLPTPWSADSFASKGNTCPVTKGHSQYHPQLLPPASLSPQHLTREDSRQTDIILTLKQRRAHALQAPKGGPLHLGCPHTSSSLGSRDWHSQGVSTSFLSCRSISARAAPSLSF